MPQVRVLTEAQLRRLVPLDRPAIDCMSNAFSTLAGGRVIMPAELTMPISEARGEIGVRTASVPDAPRFSIRVAAGFIGDPDKPTLSGQTIVFSSTSGEAEALLLDNGYLDEISTAAAGGVAARVLARDLAEKVCVLGAGLQARMQLRVLNLVRPIRSATIWSRDVDTAREAAVALTEELEFRVEAIVDPAEAVPAADIIVTATPATQPILRAEWLRPGQHVTAVGSDQRAKNEIEPACLTIARYVPDRLEQTRAIGELRAAIEAGVVAPDAEFDELGAIIAQKAPGRTSDEEITIADLTGTGVQDSFIAALACERAEAAETGTVVES